MPFTPENRRFTVTMICVTVIVVAAIMAVIFMDAAGASEQRQRQAIGIGVLLAFVGNALNQLWSRSASSSEANDIKRSVTVGVDRDELRVVVRGVLKEEMKTVHHDTCVELVREAIESLRKDGKL